MKKILMVIPMGIACFSAYYYAEIYGRSHYSLALSNSKIVSSLGNFTLPHIPGDQSIYWGSEFVVLPLLAISLFVIGRDDVLWSEWLAFSLTSLVGSAVYVIFPVAPPWTSGRNVVALGDPFGAMPSLHMSDAVIVAVCIGRVVPRFGYMIGGMYVILVGYSVISTRNHYPADIVAGIALGAAAMYRKASHTA